jgi:hypothetical protein
MEIIINFTNPKVLKDLLMAQPSFILSPVASVLDNFSEPAKSTKLITESFSVFLPSTFSNYLNSI